jgi:acetolactate synthase-1/3 small subunit
VAAPEIETGSAPGEHVISLYVNNKPGVLVRVAIVFARRGYNIDSLVVSPGARGDFSRMTIACSGDPETLEQIIKQLAKLVDVVHAIDHTGGEAYGTEIALLKLQCGTESLMLRVYGASEKLDTFTELLRPFGLRELVRSGRVLMARGLQET